MNADELFDEVHSAARYAAKCILRDADAGEDEDILNYLTLAFLRGTQYAFKRQVAISESAHLVRDIIREAKNECER